MSIDSEIESAPARSLQPGGSRITQMLAEVLLLGTCIMALMFALYVCLLLLTGSGSEHRDYVSYWASGQLLMHHQNPYDADAVLRLEHSVGFSSDRQPLIVRNPPSALLLVAPLGLVAFRAAALIWSMFLLSSWVASAWMLWGIQGRPTNRLRVLGYSFSPGFVPLVLAPALLCALSGQTGVLALLGLTLFLRFHRSQPFLAGVSLWLCALKPHLFLPVAVVLLLWIVVSRSYPVLVGAILALAAGSLIAHRLDPLAWAQYAQMMRSAGIEREFIPCLSIALRFVLSPGTLWLQYVPAAVGCVWAIWYYWSRRTTWDWVEHGPLLVLVSMLVSPYAWLTDQVLAFPALLLAAYRTSFKALVALSLASSAIEISTLCNVFIHSAFYLWTAPAWLVWYLFAVRYPSRTDLASE